MHACMFHSGRSMDSQQATIFIFLFLSLFFTFSHITPSAALPAGLDSLLIPDAIDQLIGGGGGTKKQDSSTPDHPINSPPTVNGAEEQQPQKYIIRVRKEIAGSVLSTFQEHYSNLYSSLLSSALGTTLASATTAIAPKLVHSYFNVMTGFAASLTKNQVEALAMTDWFVHAYPDRIYHLQTTHSPQYLGLDRNRGLWNATNMGEGIIIGVLDTGIFPSHPSFHDDGMPPPPSKWKGRCEFKESSSACNNKLIGARNLCGSGSQFFSSVGTPPEDTTGHGTHTSSTAAGNFVGSASALGSAAGVMAGIAPRAHIALYKVCGFYGCSGSDILAGLDAAIQDGVDVLSLSIGLPDKISFDEDPVSSGTFGAIAKGIFVSAAAGNYGPDPSSTVNEAPWITTVAASSIDRSIKSTVKLGNGLELDGESLYQPKNSVPAAEYLPLVDPSAISANSMAKYCDEGSLDDVDVRGKIVLCRNMIISRAVMANVVKKAGGAGLIILNAEVDGYTTYTDQAALPGSNVPYQYALKIKAYLNSTSNPTAAILSKGTVLGTPSPAVASFSSRGPNKVSPGILKPDITGPGVNILAAWPFPIGPPGAQTNAAFFFTESGTSMATPHISGVAALIKKAHPDWSPAAIKSAIMTTADELDRSGKPIVDERQLPADLFALGAGHVNPSRAVDPGLIYDISPTDYVSYLCGLGYNDSQVDSIVDPLPLSCADVKINITEMQLNYPSITVFLAPNENVVVSRTVTNVGEAPSKYKVVVDVPEGVSVSVRPKKMKLRFSAAGEKKRYRIMFKRNGGGGAGTVQGQLRLISARYIVRSPISIIFK